MERSTTEPMSGGTYTPPDPITTLIESCWQQAANMQHCQSERDMRVAFQAVIETRLRAIPGVASLILDDLEAGHDV